MKYQSKYFDSLLLFDTSQVEVLFHAFQLSGRVVVTSAEIRHRGLAKYRKISGDNADIIEQKTALQAKQWDETWQRKVAISERAANKETALQRTKEASAANEALGHILANTLTVDDTIDWDALKDNTPFSKPQPSRPSPPAPPEYLKTPPKPLRIDPKYEPVFSAIERLVPSAKRKKVDEMHEMFQRDLRSWEEEVERVEGVNQSRTEHYQKVVEKCEEQYNRDLAVWQEELNEYQKTQAAGHASIEARKSEYQTKLPEAISDYCDLVLSRSKYPDSFPQQFELSFNPDNGLLIVDYSLPSLSDVPSIKEVKFDAKRGELVDVLLSDRELKRQYDDVLYQITLRTIHELYEADVVDALKTIVFNGYVKSIDKSTGNDVTACVLSVQVGKEEFSKINLANVDSKACFKSLKGVGSSQLHSMTPIAPILDFQKDDKRFVDSYGVVGDVDGSTNLAAMDWEDFEHLIRELFEQEFAQNGGEVKVTQASRDGGVDAVAFDPDPIRGGKIVIQAKRYTNTVGVSAVRDLYGTVHNEGATKGILVTTTDYGPDAYEFARGKPLTLLNGSNLLHLLEKHGHRAKIDIKEAKRILSQLDNHKQ